ncbi:hypothetical protein WN48_00940 [Eufriesea mexicana]|uniref:Uncharacterized protein n=1 Tax=Eufriesea mexicana TaxID=516756 RepID=A0A310SHI5_9HYME|nr:hypothetical protein WN48_00940 [Eufriesea mexicana]
MDLIEVLWKQDVDLGFTLVEPTTATKKASTLEKGTDEIDEIEKLKALEAINGSNEKYTFDRENVQNGHTPVGILSKACDFDVAVKELTYKDPDCLNNHHRRKTLRPAHTPILFTTNQQTDEPYKTTDRAVTTRILPKNSITTAPSSSSPTNNSAQETVCYRTLCSSTIARPTSIKLE